MGIRKSVKKYDRGISKTISPSKTLQTVLKRVRKLEPGILDSYREIETNTKIPQYMVMGTDHYMQIVNDIGRVQFSFNSNGKGHFKTQAQASGLMEMVERYSCIKYLFRDFQNSTKSSFKAKRNYYDLEAFYSNPYYKDKVKVLENKEVEPAELFWYEVMTLDGKKSYLPLSLITYTFEYTNGMASGNTLEEAIRHGICEVIERHCKAVVEEGGLVTPTINRAGIKSPIIRELLDKFKALNQEVIMKDFSLGLGVPVVGVIRRDDSGKYFVTVGVAPKREEAAIRALIENSQKSPRTGLQLEGERGKSKKSISHHFQKSEVVDFEDLPDIYNVDTKKEIVSLKSLLEKSGMKGYYVDTTDPKLGIPTTIVYITNAKRKSKQIGYRNIIMGIIEESLKIKDIDQAAKYVRLGEKKDRKNIDFYLFYKALICAFECDYAKAINILTKLQRKKLYELQALIDIYIGICHLGLNNTSKGFEYLISNIQQYPTVKFAFMRTHHHFDEDLFKQAGELYNKLHSEIVTDTYECNPCSFVFS